MTPEIPAPQESASPETPKPNDAPEDFREYVKFRQTGELPAQPEDPKPQPAAAEEPKQPEPAQAKTEPQSGADDDTSHDDEEGEEPARRGGSRQRRIDKLTRENEMLKQQLAAAQPKPAEQPKPEEKPEGKPELKNYETLEAYQEALTDWKIDQREKQRQVEEQARAVQTQQQKLQTEWNSKQEAARSAHADYDDVIDATPVPEGPGVAAARQAMLEDEAGAEILYYLAVHPDEIRRIAALQPIAAVREIGRLSAVLNPPSSGSAANGKTRLSAAPKPPPPSARPAKTISDSIDDPAVQSDFKRWSKARAAMKG